MTVSTYLRDATKVLDSSSIDSSRLDVLILMEYVLGINRAKLLAEPNHHINSKDINLLNSLILQRAEHIPVSYLTHNTEFYGRSFYINSSVMQPRPESEDMITLLLKLVSTHNNLKSLQEIKIADVGTGSGCLGITAALEVPNATVDLIDIDEDALKVAKHNVVLHTINISIIKANLLPNNIKCYHILLCNLPYLPDGYKINKAASHEPKIALFGGDDGLDIYRELFEVIKKSTKKPLYILIEALPESHNALTTIAESKSYKLIDSSNFIQVFSL